MKSTSFFLLLLLASCSPGTASRPDNTTIGSTREDSIASPEQLVPELETAPPSSVTTPTDDEVKAACKLLCILTDKAITGQRKDQVAIYYNSYQALRTVYATPGSSDQYFKQIKTAYSGNLGDWIIGLRAQPSAYVADPGGFTNNEVRFINRVRSSGIAPESIDLEQVKWYQQLQGDTLDVTQLKSSEIERLKLLKSKLKLLDLEQTIPQKKQKVRKPVSRP